MHCFTVDVEEHFQVSAFEGAVRREDWPRQESRVRRNVEALLDLLAARSVKGTFFILGWIAQRDPGLVRAVSSGGHEVASHGQDHRRATRQSPEEFRASVRSSKARLEDISGRAVIGFRAPSFSIVPGGEWALDILLEEGYRYDSSMFPIRRPGGYGYPTAPRKPQWLERPAGRLFEVPLTTLRRAGWNFPAAGGAYFRILPYMVTRAAFTDCARQGVAGVFYVHPWELDPAQPRLQGPRVARFRHYTGLRRTRARLERLLSEFPFTSIRSRFPELDGVAR